MEAPKYYIFKSNFLKNFTFRVFHQLGVPKADAQTASEVLAKSDIRGIDSHGIARLRSYVDMFSIGRINPKPNVKVVREKHSIATVDGDSGLGLVVGPKANEMAMNKAADHGSGWVSVCNTNHYGIAAYYSLKALERDMIGWSMTNTSRVVAPLWGTQSMLGTNPIAIAFPGLENPPIVIDMATSVVPLGKIELARRKKETIPKGWMIDKDGLSTTDPEAMFGGSLLPLGSTYEMGGHKGYCLAAMVDVLTGVLSGANWGPFVPPFALHEIPPSGSVGKGIGHFFGAMEIDGFAEVTEFKKRIDEWILTLRKTTSTTGCKVLIPGDPERLAETYRSTHSIPVIQAVLDDLIYIASKTGVTFDWEKNCMDMTTDFPTAEQMEK